MRCTLIPQALHFGHFRPCDYVVDLQLFWLSVLGALLAVPPALSLVALRCFRPFAMGTCFSWCIPAAAPGGPGGFPHLSFRADSEVPPPPEAPAGPPRRPRRRPVLTNYAGLEGVPGGPVPGAPCDNPCPCCYYTRSKTLQESGHYTPGWRYRYDEAAWKWWHGGAPHCDHAVALMRMYPGIMAGRTFDLPEPCSCCYYSYVAPGDVVPGGYAPGPGWYPGHWSNFCGSYTWTWSGHGAPHRFNMNWWDTESGSEPDDDQGWVFTEPGATGMLYGPDRQAPVDWGHDWYFKAGPYYDPCAPPNLQVYPERGLYHEPAAIVEGLVVPQQVPVEAPVPGGSGHEAGPVEVPVEVPVGGPVEVPVDVPLGVPVEVPQQAPAEVPQQDLDTAAASEAPSEHGSKSGSDSGSDEQAPAEVPQDLDTAAASEAPADDDSGPVRVVNEATITIKIPRPAPAAPAAIGVMRASPGPDPDPAVPAGPGGLFTRAFAADPTLRQRCQQVPAVPAVPAGPAGPVVREVRLLGPAKKLGPISEQEPRALEDPEEHNADDSAGSLEDLVCATEVVQERHVLTLPALPPAEPADDFENIQEAFQRSLRSAEDLQDLEEDLSSEADPEEVANNGGPVRIVKNLVVKIPIFGEASESGASASGS